MANTKYKVNEDNEIKDKIEEKVQEIIEAPNQEISEDLNKERSEDQDKEAHEEYFRRTTVFGLPSIYLAYRRSTKDEERKVYSIFGYTGPRITFFAKPCWFMMWFCLILFFKSMVMNAFVNVSLVSIEKRYKLSSKQSSMIVSMYDIGCLMVVIPVSYYGNKGHKPLWIGFGSFLMGIGSFLYATPYFLSGYYEYVDITTKEFAICSNTTSDDEKCGNENVFSTLQNFRFIFYLAQFLTGCGSTSSYTLGFSHIEEIYDEGTSALYTGIVTAVIAISSAIGFVLSGLFLSIYVDLELPSKGLTPKDTDIWIGAWWIGFLISGFGQLLFSIPLLFFPKNNKLITDNDDKKKEIETVHIDGIAKTIKSILFNTTYIFISLATTITSLSTSGTNSYGPKYIEIVYGTTSGNSSILAGAITLPSLILGSIIGGYLLKRNNWKMKGMLIYMAVTCFISTPTALVLLLTCGVDKMAGVNINYVDSSPLSFSNLTSLCNEDCNCLQNYKNYRPSCGANKINYFSPCFAGCKNMFKNEKNFTFNNCSCIDQSNGAIQLTSKRCVVPMCSSFFINLPMLAFLFFICFMRVPPSITATMRSVKYDEKSLALGIRSIINRLIGSLPGPIIFGSLIDRVCILWGLECHNKGNCLRYDITNFTRVFSLWLFMSNLLTAIIYIFPVLLNVFTCSRFVLE